MMMIMMMIVVVVILIVNVVFCYRFSESIQSLAIFKEIVT